MLALPTPATPRGTLPRPLVPVLLLLLAGSPGWLWAQQTPGSAEADAKVDKRAREVIDRAMARYRAARTYADKMTGSLEIEATDKDGADVGTDETDTATLEFARPNRIAMKTDVYAVYCNGEKLWIYQEMLDQYTESPAPEKLDLSKIDEQVLGGTAPHPVLKVMTTPDKSFHELFPVVNGFDAVESETRDGQTLIRIDGTFDATDTPFGVPVKRAPFSLFFQEKTGLLAEIRLDIAEILTTSLGLNEEGEEPPDVPGMPRKITSGSITLLLEDVKLDADIPAEHFVYKPGPDVKKVDEFELPEGFGGPDTKKLIGKEAPTFAGEDLEGKPLDLAKLRGQVVVLDFWATWCIPCVQALPNVQKLHEQFASQPVTFIGVNSDSKTALNSVRKFVADKKLTFQQFHDDGGKVGAAYKVSAIPCTVLIGKQGIVQAVHIGFSSGGEKQVQEEIEKLLKGERLYEPQEKKPEEKKPEESKPEAE
jgi:peroxiredoxin/outer membrane lipoprotein-sorting protein